MMKSGLPENDVEAIWRLFDDEGQGKLMKDEFCAAFHVIVIMLKEKLPVPDESPSL